MFEARIEEGSVFKKIVDSIKELVKSVNLDANPTGLSLQVYSYVIINLRLWILLMSH